MNALLIIGVFCTVLPIVSAFAWKLSTGSKVIPFLSGAACFLIFAILLESPARSFIASNAFIRSNGLLYALCGALAAGLFEETGRALFFHYILKNYNDRKDAVSFGIGHGGVECLLLVGINFIAYYMYARMIANGNGDLLDPVVVTTINAIVDSTTVSSALATCVERVASLALHIALSIIVFTALRNNQLSGIPIAIALHAFVDVFAGLYQSGVITNIWVVELLIIIYSFCVSFYAFQKYKSLK